MEYQVIARRYRPRRFDEVVGQEATAATLRNAILHDRLAHAYLFCGPRGIGKTSMARIFARALNCPAAADPARPESERGCPCNACEICQAVHAGEDIDVLEMDGASHRGIEDIRDIIESVKFTPSRGRYKIYIVDEVHMLTREAFNALLKVIEEPPAHVKFIFATTEPHKIPDTVLSRCQRFDFRPIGEEETARRLRQICDAEKVEAEEGLLERIARQSRGGLRDAQTLLDQLVSFSDARLRREDLDRITGRLPEQRLDGLMAALGSGQPARVLELLEEYFRSGSDPAVLIEQIVERLRASLREKLDGGRGPEGEIDLLIGSLQILHETAARLKGSPYPQLAVELALVKLARLEDPRALEEAIEFLKRCEQAPRPGGPAPGVRPSRGAIPSPAARQPPPDVRPGPPAASAPPAAASPPAAGGVSKAGESKAGESEAGDSAAGGSAGGGLAGGGLAGGGLAGGGLEPGDAGSDAVCDFPRLRSLWDQITIEFRQRFPQLQGFLKNARLVEGGPGTATLSFNAEFPYKQLGGQRRLQAIESLIREISGQPWRLKLELDREREGNGGEPGDRTQKPSATIREDPLVKKSLDLFRGKII